MYEEIPSYNSSSHSSALSLSVTMQKKEGYYSLPNASIYDCMNLGKLCLLKKVPYSINLLNEL